jgi:hypothetical protein
MSYRINHQIYSRRKPSLLKKKAFSTQEESLLYSRRKPSAARVLKG